MPKQKVKFKSTLRNFNSNLWGYHFLVPPEIKEQFVKGKDRRVIINVNGKVEANCAIMYSKNNYYFINVNKTNRTKLKIKEGDEVEIEIWKDESEYGLPMCEEMKEMFYQDPEADAIFHKMTAGRQRTLIYLVSNPKTSATRIKKAIVLAEYLKECKGKFDFKEYNAAYKLYQY